MRRLASDQADSVLLKWLSPAEAEQAMTEMHCDAAGRPVSGVIYVRTMVDAEALPTLESEAATYESYQSYAANFARLGVTAMQATIRGREDLAPYLRAVDEVALRAITPDATHAQLENFIETFGAGGLADATTPAALLSTRPRAHRRPPALPSPDR